MLLIFKICIVNYLLTSAYGINTLMYKVVLTQRDYAQFLEYDVKAPSISEFTFCVWLRVLSLDKDQTILSYAGEANKNIIYVWLEADGEILKMTINKKIYSVVPVKFRIGTWKHLCISYQSKLGAWGIYIDGALVSCDASRDLLGFVIPGGGNIIIGNKNPINGLENGLDGEIYGFNFILESTLARKKSLPTDNQITFNAAKKKKLTTKDNFKYIVLRDLDTAKTDEILHESSKFRTEAPKRNHIYFATAHSVIDHDVGKNTRLIQNNENVMKSSKEMEIFDIPTIINTKDKVKDTKLNIWNVINEAGNSGKFKKDGGNSFFSSANMPPTIDSTSEISIFETPPPPGRNNLYFNIDKPKIMSFNKNMVFSGNKPSYSDFISLSDIETPPPLSKNNVFEEWKSMSFANDVLKYIRQKKKYIKSNKVVPATIPLIKISDSYPYMSSINPKISTFKSNNIHRKFNLKKRDIKRKEKNLQIEYYDFRDDIINFHARTKPKEVTVTNRGEPVMRTDVRFYKKSLNDNEIIGEESRQYNNNFPEPKPFMPINHRINPIVFFNRSLLKTSNHSISIDPYFYKDMYIKSLNKDNNLRNSYLNKNEYTPRNMESKINNNEILSLKMEYKTEEKKAIENSHDMTKARQLAVEIAKLNDDFKKESKARTVSTDKDNFDKHIKIGYALDERHVIGQSKTENQLSFLGGDDRIPDINNYRSDIDGTNTIKSNIPPSLRFKACSNADINDYNLNDIFSTNSSKYEAIKFVLDNFNSCSNSRKYSNNSIVLINWIESSVRLFGGASPKKTINICLL